MWIFFFSFRLRYFLPIFITETQQQYYQLKEANGICQNLIDRAMLYVGKAGVRLLICIIQNLITKLIISQRVFKRDFNWIRQIDGYKYLLSSFIFCNHNWSWKLQICSFSVFYETTYDGLMLHSSKVKLIRWLNKFNKIKK